MLDKIQHRGLDRGYLHLEREAFLDVRRLAIINVDHGHQPAFSADKNIVAVFNGEIYNHEQLRKQLTADGYDVASGSDAEIIPHAYLKWGMDFPSHFNGDFAIAIWDRRSRRLLLVRDRLGIKPLFYTRTKDGLLFGSEVKALFANPDVKRRLDRKFLGQSHEPDLNDTSLPADYPDGCVHRFDSADTIAVSCCAALTRNWAL
jgi:asparagine synthase (glutamine-hydrolysing)